MGSVYRGRDPRFDRAVAIKVLHDQFRHDPGVVERFKSEAVIQAKLNHPHIVSVLDFVADDRHLAIVMEHVEGVALDGLIAESAGALDLERVARLMDQVLMAISYAHKRGLVHRDIKPSNILVQRLDDQEFGKVTDFGIAKILGSDKLRTATGAKMGTLAYMSPEHVISPKSLDLRSDIYSLGVVLFEALTGSVPFDAESEYELMRQIVESPVERALEKVPADSAGLQGVLGRALAKRPADRFESCDEMAGALRRSLSAGSTGTGVPRSGPEQVAAPGRDLGAARHESAGAAGARRVVSQALLAAARQVGAQGAILAELAEGDGVECRVDDAFSFPTLNGRRILNLDNPALLLVDGPLDLSAEGLGRLGAAAQGVGQLLIVTPSEVDDDLEELDLGLSRRPVPVITTSATRWPVDSLYDLAVVVGGAPADNALRVKGYLGFRRGVLVGDLGSSPRVRVRDGLVTVWAAEGGFARIPQRVTEVRHCLDNEESEAGVGHLQERLARLVGGVAVIRVGARSSEARRTLLALVEEQLTRRTTLGPKAWLEELQRAVEV
ncbi:MAG: protein kinase [Vicinamibacteria bacterium]|nr:protein kinase [Vicinamibacteria bacterium]